MATKNNKTTEPKTVNQTEILENTEASAVVDTPERDAQVASVPKKKDPKRVKALDTNMYVTVTNGTHGILIYKDTTTGMGYKWSGFGDSVDMTVGELQRARSAQPKFFQENLWLFDDPEVLEFLRASQYYKHARNESGFGNIFALPAGKIAGAVEKLSDSQKTGVIAEARKRIANEQLYDIRVIRALESALQVELMIE